MTEFKCFVKSTGSIAALATGILLLAAAPGNAGHHGGNNFGQGTGGDARRGTTDRNAMHSIVPERRGGDKFDRKPNLDHAKLDHGDKYGNEQHLKHEKWGRDRERLGDGKHKMPAPAGKLVEGKKPVEATDGNPPQPVASKPVASTSTSPTGVTSPVNTIHPIASPPGGNVTISNGVTKYEIPNGAGGVSAYSSGPGKITVTNGKDSVTLNGSSVTVSNALGVGAAQNNVQVGARNGEGRTVVSVAPQKAPTATGDVTTGPGSITVTGLDVVKTSVKVFDAVAFASYLPPVTAGYGLAKGGLKGAAHEVKETAEALYGFFAF